jgi:outer membrane protein with beta-barrel domain
MTRPARSGVRLSVTTLVWLAVSASSVKAQTVEITPFVGYETSGSYPLENPADVQALRADAGRTYGFFADYRLMQNLQGEFYWVGNKTTYSQQSTATGAYSTAFNTRIDQYQFGALYHLRDRDHAWRPYLAGSLGFTHDSNGGVADNRTAFGLGLGGGFKYEPSRHFGVRVDARWMPTYGSSGLGTYCDEFYGCYQDTVANYLQRFNAVMGLVIRP